MKSTNNLIKIKNKSLHELKKEVLKSIEELEKKKDLKDSINQYQELIELNNIIQNKFKEKAKDITVKTSELLKKISKKYK
tara:strand:+ start:659 stop:898 length:240 start_codon:yes stop_codon:yes gene_type:complete